MTSIYTPEEAKKVIKAVTLSGIAVAIADMGLCLLQLKQLLWQKKWQELLRNILITP